LPIPAKYLSHPENGNLLPGLRGDYFDNAEMVGEAVEVKVAENISFNFWDQSPLEGFDDDNYSIRWTGFIEAPVDGTYLIGGFGSNYKIYFEDSLFVSYSNVHESGQRCSAIDLVKGEKYNLKVEAYDNGGDCQIELRWRIPVRDLELEALEAASNADVVIMCMGLSPRLEGEEMKVPVEGFEGGDRTSLDLPFVQVDLMKKVLQANKNVVLVLLNGSALSINWADDNIPAIVEAWYPGQAGGTAVADVLFGNYNPAGRLPVTFYKSVDDLPPFDNYDMDGRTYKYFSGAPLYPFGHGLSYTTFQYSNMQVPENSSTSENLKVSVQLKNTGPVAGDEVVQFYVSRKDRNNLDPICKLLGFERIHLEPGEEMQVEFTIESRQLSGIDENGNRVLQPGIFKVFIGGGQERYADGLAAEIEINGSPVSFRH
jgi:beta-glucosidase